MKKIRGLSVIIIIGLIGFLAYERLGLSTNFSFTDITESIQSYNIRIEDLKAKAEEIVAKAGQTEEILAEENQTEEIQTNTEIETEFEEEAIMLPSVYDARQDSRGSRIKNQEGLGTCWAFASSSALEAALLPGEHLEFSPDHISLKNGYDKDQDEGGAYTMTMAYLSGWKGPVLEEDDPYGDGYSPDGLEPVKHVQEIQLIRDKNYEEIKRAVYLYGAVQASLHMDMMGSQQSSIYYNELYRTYCYTGEEDPNHDILIIGWDDDFSAEFFTNTEENGAFICQNSWGPEFGDWGIFYVSYSDTVLGNSCIAISRIEPANNYDYIYQSDLCGWLGQMGYNKDTSYFANVYKSNTDETLEAVGFYATGENTSYEVYVVENFEGTESLAGKREVKSGKLRNAGYYTVDLKESIPLSKNQKFAVVVKIITPDSLCPVAAECETDDITINVDISDGEGYISLDGVYWASTEQDYKCNVILKAYSKASFP